jgi:hypothetical protein
METIERINDENIHLHDEINGLRHSVVRLINNIFQILIVFFDFRKQQQMKIIYLKDN